MQSQTVLRPLSIGDYDEVVRLWRNSAGVEVAEGDEAAGIAAYLARNPGLSQVAECGGRIVGAVLCGHDGRRGLLYHLAVAQEYRGQGLGRRLVAAGLAGLKSAGIKRALILVAKDNADGLAFWRGTDFEEISGALPLGKDLE